VSNECHDSFAIIDIPDSEGAIFACRPKYRRRCLPSEHLALLQNVVGPTDAIQRWRVPFQHSYIFIRRRRPK